MRMHTRDRGARAVLVVAAALMVQGCALIPPALVQGASAVATAMSVSSWVDRQAQESREEMLRAQGRRDAGMASTPKERDADAYRQGIREALAQMQRNGGSGLAAPDAHRLTWIGPVMEEVWVPARVVGGMMVPEHRTWVVVTPGRWATPDDGQREPAAGGGIRPARYTRGPF